MNSYPQDAIDPSELSLDTNFQQSGRPIQQQGGFMSQGYDYGNNSQSFNFSGSGGIATDELLELGNLNNAQSQNFPVDDFALYSPINTGVSGLQVGSSHDIYSQTPHDAPPESPFIKNFPNNHHLRGLQQHQPVGSFPSNHLDSPASYTGSPVIHSVEDRGFDSFMVGGSRRGHSGSQPIANHHLSGHRGHQKSLSATWNGDAGSGSYPGSSALSSPHSGSLGHMPISDRMGGKHGSLPAKVEMSQTAPAVPGLQTQEAKRRRRRESHNMVERRRRDNINERIQELSHLVPHHRLEDEKVRKHLMNNSPMSPTVGPTGSPPRATSGLAGPGGRRATAVASSLGPTALPGEEKDKGPNKGDILNGAVGWTRDLMWALHEKITQEKELQELVQRLGGTWPFTPTEEQGRMESELVAAIEKNGVDSFEYSRAPGTGLRVPHYTDLAGNPTNQSAGGSTAALLQTPPVSRTRNTGGNSTPGSAQGRTPNYWSNGMLKEEDEYGMDIS